MKMEARSMPSAIFGSCLRGGSSALAGAVRVYQLAISPLTGPSCRFYPTCSSYAVEAIREHGGFQGAWLVARRILKCHPFHPGGVDLVPGTENRHRPDRDGSGE